MTDELLTPNAVALYLSELGRQLDAVVSTLRESERDAAAKRHEADMIESRAFVAADGAVELRKHMARLATDHAEQEALVAEATLRWLRARIRAIDTRIEIGRTLSATVRAEMKALPYQEGA